MPKGGYPTTDRIASLNAALDGRYRLVCELGRGGMAVVYRADDVRHDRQVALKILRHELAASLATARFLLEIRVTARLQHSHILALLDSGEVTDDSGVATPYYVMPCVEGESLRDRLAREHQLPVSTALGLARDMVSALVHAHAQGVVHRDIKPENILLSGGTTTPDAMVVDFGIAAAVASAGGERLTQSGLVLGTPHYMSPEQAAGDPATDARSDIYAAGCVLYEMLAGEPPYTGPTAQAVMARAMTEPTPLVRKSRPAVPAAVDLIIARAMAKVPADRFQAAAEMHQAVLAALEQPHTGRKPSSKRRRWAIAATALALVILAAVSWPRMWNGHTPSVVAGASSIAVLPPTPSVSDTALARLGRDLVFTLTAELDGLGGIRAADAHSVLALTRSRQPSSVGDQASLARSLGAGSFLQGSLVRVGSDVRLDVVLLPADSNRTPIARATVTAPPDSVAVLTDSVVRALVAQAWSRNAPPTPSLDAALRTRSVPALRAFLEGEGALSHGEFDSAAIFYEQAMHADPSFRLAAVRYALASYWTLVEPADSVLQQVRAHLADLPERDRLAAEAILLRMDSTTTAIDRLQVLVRRYPDFWYGWLLLGDVLLHDGPLLGHATAEARAAFENAVALNADLIPAWEHLELAALVEQDTTLARQAVDALERLDAWPVLTADGYGNRRLQFYYLGALLRGDTSAVLRLRDSIALDPAPLAADGSFYDSYGFGFFAEQVDVSRRALAHAVRPNPGSFHARVIPLAFIGRGAWDSALAGLDARVAGGGDSLAALRTWGLATLGAWLGAVDVGEATARRPRAVATARTTSERAEVAWLDGVTAATRGDRSALERARADLRQGGDPAARSLDRSLAALGLALRGDSASAGDALAALEWEQAATGSPDFAAHPLVIPLDRLAGARLLGASGKGDEALRLLRWSNGVFLLHPTTTYTPAFAPIADLERARIERQLGHPGLADEAYERFRTRLDLPTARYRALVDGRR